MMARLAKLFGAALVALTLVYQGHATAQAPSESHMRAAWAAIRAVGADSGFDEALPDIANRITVALRDQRPDVGDQIETVVYDVTFELIPRRLDLNNEISLLWANAFTEEELNQITEFYNSDVGQKLNQLFNDIQVDTLQLLDDWYVRTLEEVRERVFLRLEQQGITF